MNAADRILRKALVASGLDTRGWSSVQAGLRDRAFFSSQVEDARILHAMRANVAALADGTKDISEVRRDLREFLAATGYDPGDGRGTIRDLYTKARLDVMARTNVDQAKGYAGHLRATSAGAILAFPAYELVRVERRRVPRDWNARWAAAARKVGFDGVARNGAMVALKTSPVWAALSRFGNPFPPFDFNSGMGVRDVRKSVCRELGLLGPDEQPKVPPPPDFNGNLSARVPFAGNTPEFRRLKDVFGDQITHAGGEVRWRADLVRDAFESGRPFEIRLGKPTDALRSMLPTEAANRIKQKSFIVTDDWLDSPRKSGGTHRDHFWPRETDPRNLPLTSGDLELIPTLWRQPDRVVEGGYRGSIICELDTIDGGTLKMVVDVKRMPAMHTLYKNKSGLGLGASD